jgi:hypothetical protein
MNKLTGNKDVDILIINKLNDYELGKVCQVNRHVRAICNDETFWRIRTYEKFGNLLKEFDIDISKHRKTSWKDYYMLLSKVAQKAAKGGYKRIAEMGGPRAILKKEPASDDWQKVKDYKYILIGNTINEEEGMGNIFERSYLSEIEKHGYAMTNVGDIISARKDLLAMAFLVRRAQDKFNDALTEGNFSLANELMKDDLVNPNAKFYDLTKPEPNIINYLIKESVRNFKINPAPYAKRLIYYADFDSIKILSTWLKPEFIIKVLLDEDSELLTEEEFLSNITLKKLLKIIGEATNPINERYKPAIKRKLLALKFNRKDFKKAKNNYRFIGENNLKFLKKALT